MKRILIGTAALAGMTFGLSAHASCADPRTIAPESAPIEIGALNPSTQADLPSGAAANAEAQIVGTWHVTYTSGGAYFAQALMQWHSDHTEWENITQPVLGGNICMGSWKALDAWSVARNHYGWLYTAGKISGYFVETETDHLAANGNSYEGTNVTKIYDMHGNLEVTVKGTSSATRIEP